MGILDMQRALALKHGHSGLWSVNETRQYLLDNCVEQVAPIEGSPCWIWQPGLTIHGYGRLTYQGQRQFVQRVSYKVFVGSFPEELFIIHSCDNPARINPDHLRPGTCQDNNDDMYERGRNPIIPVGGNSPRVTEQTVLQIREKAAEGKHSLRYIAKLFGLSSGAVWKIVNGVSWPEVGGPRTFIGRPEKSSQYIGVTFIEHLGKLAARAQVKGKNLHFGCFENELDAARAYNAAVIERNLNKPLNEIPNPDQRKETPCVDQEQAAAAVTAVVS
jgi:hypothetical protein